MNIRDSLALFALTRIPNLGNISIKKLIKATGSPEAVFTEKRSNLLKIDGIGSIKIDGLHDSQYQKQAEKELKFITDHHIQYNVYSESGYPSKLKQCNDSPVLLFNTGTINLDQKKVLSIVGTRKATPYGVRFCEELIETLAPLDPVIVSGFAYGIDIIAHRAAVQHQLQTIGCLAHGLDQIYPKAHKKYVTQIEAYGGFFTDYWSIDPFERKNFLGRNRIIAGLSDATIVIESAIKGGSLVTANLANTYHRDVFAVPGRVGDPYSEGCNMLIQTHKAHMVRCPEDIPYLLNWNIETNSQSPIPSIQKQLFVVLEENEEKIYEFLKHKGKTMLDMIALECNIPTYQAASLLLSMELKGVVKPLPGKCFEIV